jgi:hypothetical protein
MIKRDLVKINTGMPSLDKSQLANYKTISANYFPVDSAISMRDTNSNL